MNEHPVILFDGVCNFCNGAVNFIIKHDKKRIFRFAALQSETGQRLLKQYHLSPTQLDSFVLIDNGKAYKKTTAALHLYPKLGGMWKLAKILWILPPFIRDAGYNIIATNRYRWWGKKRRMHDTFSRSTVSVFELNPLNRQFGRIFDAYHPAKHY